jgi:tRNA dimethylallyltransferase
VTGNASADPPVVIVGPTATGKSALAMELARRWMAAQIVSMDSMQVYRGMDIGTAKATAAEQAEVTHHMLDVVEPSVDFDLSQFQSAAKQAIADIEAAGDAALLVGGTGLYVQAVVDDLELPGQFPEMRAALEDDPDTEGMHRRLAELDPVGAARMEPTNRRRIVRALSVTLGSGRPFSSFGPGVDAYPTTRFVQIGLDLDRDELDRRIALRYQVQLEAGLLDEVQRLLGAPGGLSRSAGQALGYKEFVDHLAGRQSLEEALAVAIKRTRRFARRQQRWFRRDPRITWLDATENPQELAHQVEATLNNPKTPPPG